MKRLLPAILLILVLTLAGGDRLRPDQAEAGARCVAANATRTTVAAVAKNPKAWNGRCVKITAVLDGSWLYETVDGLYELNPDLIDPTSNGLRLGLDDRRPGDDDPDDFRETTVIGRVQDCEEVRAMAEGSAPPETIVMVSGYCHYYSGVYIWVVDLKQGAHRPFERQTVQKTGTYGDLVPAPAEWDHRAKIEAMTARFLSALQARDEAALARLMTPDPDEPPAEETLATVRFMLHAPSSPFIDLPTRDAPQTRFMVARYLDDGVLKLDTTFGSTVCFCRTADCTGRWPIAEFDAENQSGRPYACIRVHGYIVFRKGNFPVVNVPVEKDGLTEPVG